MKRMMNLLIFLMFSLLFFSENYSQTITYKAKINGQQAVGLDVSNLTQNGYETEFLDRIGSPK